MFFIANIEAQTRQDTLAKDCIDIISYYKPQKEIEPYEPKPIICYFLTEQMPQYRGGEEALRKYIAENTRKIEQGKEGRVVVKFTIDRDGCLKDASIVQSLSKEADQEALRVVNSIPEQWRSGMQNGRKVSVGYVIPLYFKNSEDD